eukprot:616117-Amorphochlora_amoeboformis.AAC.1
MGINHGKGGLGLFKVIDEHDSIGGKGGSSTFQVDDIYSMEKDVKPSHKSRALAKSNTVSY